MPFAATTVQFDTAALPPGSQFLAWRDAVVGYTVSRTEGRDEDPFVARVTGLPMGQAALVRAELENPLNFVAIEASRQPNNVSIVLLQSGTLRGEAEGRAFSLESGQVMLFDWRRPVSVFLSPAQAIVLIVPGEALGGMPDLHAVPLSGTTGRLLTGYLLLLAHQAVEASSDELSMLGEASLPLVGTCLAASTGRAGERAASGSAIRRQVERHIELRLGDPHLGLSSILSTLGISRSGLYRAFAATGGVARHIQQRRLEAAHAALSEPGRLRTVKSIAHAFGFSSMPHFNAAFRRRYGYNPSNARLGALPRLHAGLELKDAPPHQRLAALVASLGR